MNNNIEGKIIIITGASSGLGEAAARHLAAEGASVVLAARRSDRIDRLASEITSAGGKGLSIATDVTSHKDMERLAAITMETLGRIDVLINNAGVMPLSPIERLKIEEWDQMINVNFKGVLYRYRGGTALYEGAEVGPHHQHGFRRRLQGFSSVSGLLRDQIRCTRPD